MSTVVAMLRGINVGGKNKVPMAELRSLVAELGHRDVKTLIQSGNLVFEPAAGSAVADEAELSSAVATAVADRFGVTSPVIVRSVEELRAALADNPFADDEDDPAKVHLVFLDREPDRSAVSELDLDRSPPDVFELRGRHLFLWYPDGSARSKLTLDYFERVLGVTGTARNLRTVTKLLDLATSGPER